MGDATSSPIDSPHRPRARPTDRATTNRRPPDLDDPGLAVVADHDSQVSSTVDGREWACDPDDVDWGPLERFVEGPVPRAARVTADGFMWMGTVIRDVDRVLHAYKHVDTRRYLYLDGDAVSYLYADGELHPAASVGDALVALGWFA